MQSSLVLNKNGQICLFNDPIPSDRPNKNRRGETVILIIKLLKR